MLTLFPERLTLRFMDDLRAWREARKLPRRAVADVLGVTEMTVYRWENGRGEPRQGDLELLERHWPDPVVADEGAA